MEKNRLLNQSLSHSPSLSDAPGTEAFASESTFTRHCIIIELPSHEVHHFHTPIKSIHNIWCWGL